MKLQVTGTQFDHLLKSLIGWAITVVSIIVKALDTISTMQVIFFI
jgi:hypothetical protein